MPTTKIFNQSAYCRARSQLHVFQSNVIVQTGDGSEIRGVWEGCRFVDYQLGEPIEEVRDFWIDDRLPDAPGICLG